jgi:hypothetical protein
MDPGAPRRWVLVGREVGVAAKEGGSARWSLDHLFLDQDGIPTLIEVKQRSDSRIRREVVGQMLDYAANAVVYWPADELRTRFEEECLRCGFTPEEVIRRLVEEDVDEKAFWTTVKTNLRAGRVRLVFVADQIPPELQQVIEFLNEQMDPAVVLGVEVPQFVGGGLQTIVPRVVGWSAASQRRKGTEGGRARIGPAEFLDRCTEPGLRAALGAFLAGCQWNEVAPEWGSVGCSLRLRLPGISKPLSVGWLFPPGIRGWMGLTDVTLGFYRSAVAEGDSTLRPLLEYVESVGVLEGAEPVPPDWIHAYRLPPEAAVRHLPRVLELIERLKKELGELASRAAGNGV